MNRNIYCIFEEFNLKFYKFKNYENFEAILREDRRSFGRLFGQTYFDYVENYINENEKKLIDLVNSHNHLQENIEELIDKKLVWEKTYKLVTNKALVENSKDKINNIGINIELQNNISNQNRRNIDDLNNLDNEFNYNKINNNNFNNNIIDIESNLHENRFFDLKIISGIIPAEDQLKFKKLIFRSTKGLAYPNFFELEYAENQMYSVNGKILNLKNLNLNEAKHKNIFVIFVQGQGLLMQKILKVCDLIRAPRYSTPNEKEFYSEIQKLQKEIDDKKIFLIETENSIRNFVAETENVI